MWRVQPVRSHDIIKLQGRVLARKEEQYFLQASLAENNLRGVTNLESNSQNTEVVIGPILIDFHTI
jgi:hypothetical protein